MVIVRLLTVSTRSQPATAWLLRGVAHAAARRATAPITTIVAARPPLPALSLLNRMSLLLGFGIQVPNLRAPGVCRFGAPGHECLLHPRTTRRASSPARIWYGNNGLW